MKTGAKMTTDIYRFDVKKNSWTKRKDYELLYTFKFAGNEYCLTANDEWYFVCSCFDDEDSRLYSLYRQKKKGAVPGEVVSEFRKLYLKNEITLNKITNFLLEPLKFCKKQ